MTYDVTVKLTVDVSGDEANELQVRDYVEARLEDVRNTPRIHANGKQRFDVIATHISSVGDE